MKKAHMCIILSGERLKDFSVKSEINQWCPLSPLHFNTIMEARSEQLYKMNNEKLQNGREEEIVYLYMTYLIAITPKNKKKNFYGGLERFPKDMGREDQHVWINGTPLRIKGYIHVGSVVFRYGTKIIHWGKTSVCCNWCEETRYPRTKEWSQSITSPHVNKLTPNGSKN